MKALSTHASGHAAYFIAEESARNDTPRPALYLDTTVVSYLTAARLSRHLSIARHQRITRVWWERYRHLHTLWISNVVFKEASAGDIVESKTRLNAVMDMEALDFDSQSKRLAEKLVGGGRLPEKAQTDAKHVAIAATNSIPLLHRLAKEAARAKSRARRQAPICAANKAAIDSRSASPSVKSRIARSSRM